MIAFVMVPRPRPLVEDGVPKAHVILLVGQVKPNKGVTELCSGALIFGQAIPAAVAVLPIMVVVIIIATAHNIFFFPMRDKLNSLKQGFCQSLDLLSSIAAPSWLGLAYEDRRPRNPPHPRRRLRPLPEIADRDWHVGEGLAFIFQRFE
jgi:hypothetical protein